jgi:hypothetical protein
VTDKKIQIRCRGNRFLPYVDFKGFQGNLKTMSRADFDKLKRSILTYGWVTPVFVWNKVEILDGHGRLRVLGELLSQGYTIDPIPVVDIDASSRREAAQILLQINSNFQKITDNGLYEYMATMEIKAEDLENVTLPEINLERFIRHFFQEGGGEGEGKGAGGGYNISYTIPFDNEEQQTFFFRWIRWLKKRYPDCETIAERLIKAIGVQMEQDKNGE